jgi:hypothetical protein
MDKLRSKLLSVSVLALLGAAGCGQVNVTENAAPSSSTPGGGLGTVPTQPTNPPTGQPNNPGTPSNPSTGTPTNPPAEAIGDPATATANGAVLTSTQTTVYNLNATAVGEGSWQSATLIEDINSQGPALGTRVGLDDAGNGFSIYTYRNGFVYVSRYTASTASWSAPLRLDSGTTFAIEPRIAVDRQTGNAIATWIQSDGTAPSLYVRQYDAATSTWGTAQLLETSSFALPTTESSAVSINGSHAAVVWRQRIGPNVTPPADPHNIYLSRLVDGVWTTPVVVDTSSNDGLRAEVAIDTNGNVIITWRQLADEHRIHARRWNNTTQSFGSVILLDNEGDRQPRLGMDDEGNAFALWRNGGIYVRRYDVTSGTWGPQITVDDQTGSPITGELSVDAAGNAIAAWGQITGADTEFFVARYSASTGTWGAAELMETSALPLNLDKNPTVSINGNDAVVAWVQKDPTNVVDSVYARELSAGVWGPVTLLETNTNRADDLSSSINLAGNSVVVWGQIDAYAAHYLSSNFVVPNGATWQSVANTLYGVNSVEGGNALQAALGGIALTPGAILTGLPATLSVTTSVPAYYTVLATDTWSHIARTVYGVTDVNAIAELRASLGNPTLAAGLQLVVPSSYNYVTSGSYSAPLNWSLVNTTTTTYHPIDTSELTTPLDSWSAQELMETQGAAAITPRVAFDANSNGVAVWAQGSDLMMSRYVASTGTWSDPVALDSNTNEAHNPRLAMDRATGNAVVSWTQSDGTAESIYASSFTASTNDWSTPALLETSNAEISGWYEDSAAAKAGNHAAVAWMQIDGTENNIYLSRFVGGTWTAPALIDTTSDEALQVDVAVDGNGNVSVIWRQMSQVDGEYRINVRRWDNVAQAYGAVAAIDGDGDRQPHIAFDAQGNGFALWGGGAYARRFNVTTGQWGPQVQLNVGDIAGWNGEISVDASGDALAAWMEHDGTTINVYARYYDVSTQSWGDAVLLENSATPAIPERNLSVSLVNGSGVVTWAQDEPEVNLYAARFADGVWGSATLLDADSSGVDALAAAIDANNNATVLWTQGGSVYRAVSNATPYYLVPAGATWRSIAATLYNEDSDAAGQALQTAMSNTPLSTGLHLQGMPATLVVTPQVATHYIVQSGDTWLSITLGLYGTNVAQAVTALQNILSNPTLTVGAQLFIPSELNYSVPDET